MSKVGLIYAYYDNGEMLRTHLAEWINYPKYLRERLHIVIVDDASPKRPAAAIVKESGAPVYLDISVFRIVPNIPWNQDGARNLAMQMVKAEWVLMMDMDHLLPSDQAERMVALADRSQRGVYYMPLQKTTDGKMLPPHPNQYLFHRLDFWNMGGYDEDFAGVYGSDGNFRRCARGAGRLEERYTSEFYSVVYRTEDIFDANTKDWGRKESSYYRANFPELEAKRRSKPYKAVNPIRFEWHRVL